MAHKLLRKKSMDAVNEELLKPTHDPRAEEYNSPFAAKGTEFDPNKMGRKAAAPRKNPESDVDYLVLAEAIAGSLDLLARIAPKGGDIHAMADMSASDLRHFIQTAKREARPDYVSRDASRRKRAEISLHSDTKVLPPRTDIRSHLDEDIKKEIHDDTHDDTTKSGAAKSAVQLTQEQDDFWVRAFESYANHLGMAEDQAVDNADRDTIHEWPELAKFQVWKDAGSRRRPTKRLRDSIDR